MNSFEIFVDSAANLPDDLIEKYDIGVISYTCSINGKEMQCYEKGVPYDEIAKKFYDAMREGAETKTTLVNAEKMIDALTPTLKAGKDVILIIISSKISGTFNQALEAKKQLEAAFPERKVLVFDSFNASLGEGMFAVYAARMREEGKNIDECYQWMNEHQLKMNSVVTVSSLKYLKQGGRISSATAIVGTILNIKPVIWGSDKGVLEVLCNERGRKKAIAKLAALFAENVIEPANQTIAIAHADCREEAEELASKLKELGATDIIINMYDLCTGAHIGPGTIALFFLGKERGKSKEAQPEASAAKKGFFGRVKQ